MSTAKFSTWLNPDGTENYKCRAWVNFNGTGTVAIRAAGNVASITDNGTGNYTVNFTTAMPDANYAAAISGQDPAGGAWVCGLNGGIWSTTAVQVASRGTNSFFDGAQISVAIFR